MNVLILSAGRRVSLVASFNAAVKELQIESTIYTADMNPQLSAACQKFGNSIALPHCASEDYLESLVKACKAHVISVVIPTLDTELQVLADNRGLLLDAGINVVVSHSSLVKQCRDKRLTHTLFEKIGLPIPQQYSSEDLSFPCFCKPISGSLSKGIRTVWSQNEFDNWEHDHSNYLYMELIGDEYDEYTIDAYYDRQSLLKCAVPRKRIEVRGGEISKGVTNIDLERDLWPILKNLEAEGPIGCLTVQVFVNSKSNKTLGIEVNPRFGGGFPLTYHAGGKFPAWIIQEYIQGLDVTECRSWTHKMQMLRYDAEVLSVVQ